MAIATVRNRPLGRENISNEAAEAVRAMIADGRLKPGERVNEVHVAAALGVSRTPLREGLRLLAAEGTLDAAPRRGFFIRPLSVREFEELYDIRPILDPEALRIAGLPTPARIARLEKLDRALAEARGAAAVDIDNEWHLALIADCPNRVLLELIKNMIARTRRYEIALMRSGENVGVANADHRAIIAALKAGDLGRACVGLKRNMRSGKAAIADWLKDGEALKQ
ncbi:MAG TPA: GntR family transcriptional regulator [Parvularculaceae bacterium]|nr:GntR family transcriptional regulator [Parvularculaceae bacterium]